MNDSLNKFRYCFDLDVVVAGFFCFVFCCCFWLFLLGSKYFPKHESVSQDIKLYQSFTKITLELQKKKERKRKSEPLTHENRLSSSTHLILIVHKLIRVHELDPKKWVFGSHRWTKHNIDF